MPIPMDSTELKAFAQCIRDHLYGHILPFWCGPALDHEQGGWLAWLSNDLQPDRTQPKGLILNTRILWSFSAVCRHRSEPVYRQMADRAFEVVMNRFWDLEHGGAFWRLDDRGKVLDNSKKTYGQAFYLYALAEYYRAFRVPAALDRARELFVLIERQAYDPQHRGYWEVRRRDWSEADANARLSEKDLNEKKSMNNHLHVLEAFTNLHRVWPEARVEQRLRELIGLFQQRILDARTHHLHHFFDEAWRVRSDSYTFGHDIEASWLLCEAAEVLGDPALLKQVRETALCIASVVRQEGIETDSGLCYEGRKGEIIDRGKEGWPQAEALVGFLNAFQIGGDVRFLEAARGIWSYVEQRLMDRNQGEWFWRITPEGHVDTSLPKVSEWKGPYHATRACLEAVQRLEAIVVGKGMTA